MKDFIQALAKHATSTVTPEAERRADICARCPKKDKRNYADFLDSKIVEINGFVCTLCDCPLATKIFAQNKENICDKWKE